MTATTILTEVLTVMVLAATAGTQTGACADRYDIEQFRTQTLANAEQQLESAKLGVDNTRIDVILYITVRKQGDYNEY